MAFKMLVLVALLGAAAAGPSIVSHGDTGRLDRRLGAKQCTFGPAYWCDHISKASQCKMTSWCIDNVWRHMDLPEDSDDVCTICKNMVKEARDQLNSNETQEELKEVLEGSCDLIPIRLIAEECDTLVDDFIPELTEMLTSEMNPQVVCQTAGLCNSARVDKLLEDRSARQGPPAADSCATCGQRLDSLSRAVSAGGQQQLLDTLLPVCRDLGSYSDACAADLASNIGSIFAWLQRLDSREVCLLGNACPGLYDQPPLQLRGAGPSVDCDLCIHIVKHWRDILVANTTKEEFKEILDGICAKTKAWAPKCTQLVDEYYVIIYDYLVNQMRAHSICKAIGLCAKPGQADTPLWATVPAGSEAAAVLSAPAQQSRPLIPLEHPLEAMPLAELTPSIPVHNVVPKKGDAYKLKKKLHRVKLHKTAPHAYGNDGLAHRNPLESSEPAAAVITSPQQLPLGRLGLPDVGGLFRRDTELCDLCEYSLHQLQKVLEDDATEDEISEEVGRLCDLLPATLTGRCHQFVSDYGSFVVQLLAQEIDPSQICPALHLCPLPSSESEELSSTEESSEELSSAEAGRSEPPGCAICEYAMNTLLDYLKDKKTEDEIRQGLDRVCEMLPATVSRECRELVNTFMEEIIDMIVSDMTADEICITLRLCTGSVGGNDVASNSIHAVPLPPSPGLGPFGMRFAGLAAPLAGLPVNSPQLPEPVSSEEDLEEEEEGEDVDRQSSVCILCEFVMMQLKMKLSDNSTDAEIEAELKRVCTYMPSSVRADCDGFVDEYGAALLDALKASLADPDRVCEEIQLCQPQAESPPEPASGLFSSSRCGECQQIVAYAELLLADGRLQHMTSEELCQLLPAERRQQCNQLVQTYGPWVMSQLTQNVSPRHVCIGIDLCPHPVGTVHLMGGARCLWGPDYVCQDEFHARSCDALQYCVEQVWNSPAQQMP